MLFALNLENKIRIRIKIRCIFTIKVFYTDNIVLYITTSFKKFNFYKYFKFMFFKMTWQCSNE